MPIAICSVCFNPRVWIIDRQFLNNATAVALFRLMFFYPGHGYFFAKNLPINIVVPALSVGHGALSKNFFPTAFS